MCEQGTKHDTVRRDRIRRVDHSRLEGNIRRRVVVSVAMSPEVGARALPQIRRAMVAGSVLLASIVPGHAAPDALPGVFPGATWARIADPREVGSDATRLAALQATVT